MMMIIGFGSTETDREKQEERDIREHVRLIYGDTEKSYFSDSFIKEVSDWVSERGRDLRSESDSYKSAETFPDRYGYYYPTVIADPSHIVVILKWSHINRRHAMSPDGWASLRTRSVFVIDRFDDLDSVQTAAAA